MFNTICYLLIHGTQRGFCNSYYKPADRTTLHVGNTVRMRRPRTEESWTAAASQAAETYTPLAAHLSVLSGNSSTNAVTV